MYFCCWCLSELLLFIYLLVFYFWLCRVSAAARGLSLVALCCSVWPSRCCDFSCWGAPALGTQASAVVAHGLSCSTAQGIFPDQGDQTCVPSIGRQISILSLYHQRSPSLFNLLFFFCSWPCLASGTILVLQPTWAPGSGSVESWQLPDFQGIPSERFYFGCARS